MKGISEALAENIPWSRQRRQQEGFSGSHSGDVTHEMGAATWFCCWLEYIVTKGTLQGKWDMMGKKMVSQI